MLVHVALPAVRRWRERPGRCMRAGRGRTGGGALGARAGRLRRRAGRPVSHAPWALSDALVREPRCHDPVRLAARRASRARRRRLGVGAPRHDLGGGHAPHLPRARRLRAGHPPSRRRRHARGGARGARAGRDAAAGAGAARLPRRALESGAGAGCRARDLRGHAGRRRVAAVDGRTARRAQDRRASCRTASTSPSGVCGSASTSGSMPCSRSAALVTGPIERAAGRAAPRPRPPRRSAPSMPR